MPERSVNCPLPRDGRTWIALIFFILIGGMLLLLGLYFFIRTLIWAIGVVIIALVIVFMCIFMFCPKCLTACTCNGGGEAEKEHSYEGSCRYAKDGEAARSRKRRRQRRRSSSGSSSDDSEYERERRRRKRRRKERRSRSRDDSDDSYDDIRYEDETRRRKGKEKDDNDANEKRKKWMPACVARRRDSGSDSGLDVP
ncbi:Hypp5230 [Branchiostoma lanceolatum]|uniref:Hypp5230 protein n=1 Tax=Branchiostoma lanceolatum TaxID=7740 RepID=A0A8K0EYQ4_BRALA|nr:Hypp5230 [Branchiostoma lanceolatum]